MTILCYHSVDPLWQSPLAVSPRAFSSHMEWLAGHRTVVSLATMMAWRSAGLVSVTFDDGLVGVFDHALPVLRRLGIPATVFVVSETLSSPPQPVDWVDSAPSWTLETMTAAQLLELEDAGVRVESHSSTHADLTTLDPMTCQRDLRASRECLEDLLHRRVEYLAYPRGRHNATVREAARRAGYVAAFALPQGKEAADRFAIPRVGIYPQNGIPALRIKTASQYVRVRTSAAYPNLPKVLRRSRSGAGAVR